jgi:putative tryptophan/tyrosine transport system substrate-binding protein
VLAGRRLRAQEKTVVRDRLRGRGDRVRRGLLMLACVVLASLVAAGEACAQQGGRVFRVGYLWLGTPEGTSSERWAVFKESLQSLGYREGRNVVFDVRDARGDPAALAAVASSLSAAGPDVIVTQGGGTTASAMKATSRIPIVFGSAADPVGRGLVASLARPGGNVTGYAVDLASAKGFEILREIAPAVRRAGLPVSRSIATPRDLPTYLAGWQAAARSVGFEVSLAPIAVANEVEPALAALAGAGGEAIFVSNGVLLASERRLLLSLAPGHRLASVCNDPADAAAGCLVTYSDNVSEGYRHAARLVDRILKGANPAELPVEQPTKFNLAINLRTARALGLTIPPSILARADEVIE